MNIRAGAFFLALAAISPIWAEAPGKADAPPWMHKFGGRLGSRLLYHSPNYFPHKDWVSLFYECQFNGNWAVRPSYEIDVENFRYVTDNMPPSTPYWDASIRRTGVAADCIYYLSGGNRQNGTKLYLLAGLGVHRVNVDHFVQVQDSPVWTRIRSTSTVPARSVGFGYHFSKYFALEYKYTESALESPLPDNMGNCWNQFTMNFRFPVPGLPKGNWQR